jgi:hypothetical protein
MSFPINDGAVTGRATLACLGQEGRSPAKLFCTARRLILQVVYESLEPSSTQSILSDGKSAIGLIFWHDAHRSNGRHGVRWMATLRCENLEVRP